MAQNFQSGFSTTLALPAGASDTTLTLNTVPTVTSGRLYLANSSQDDAQKEWIKFTGVSGQTVTGCTRGLSQTGDPVTGGTGYTWIAGTSVTLVAMHDQFADKTASNTYASGTTQAFQIISATDLTFAGTTTPGLVVKSLTTTQRTALTPVNGTIVYDSTIGVHYQYIGGAWATFSSGTTVNADTTTAGKVEISTQAETEAGTATGGSGATLVPTNATINPNNITPTTVATNDKLTVSDVSDSNKLKSVLISDILSNGLQLASDAEALAGTVTAKAISPKQLDTSLNKDAISFTWNSTGSQVVTHNLGRIPKSITINAVAQHSEGSIAGATTASRGFYDGTDNNCTYYGSTTSNTYLYSNNSSYSIFIQRNQGSGAGYQQLLGSITSITSTNFTITRTTGGNGGPTTYCTALVS